MSNFIISESTAATLPSRLGTMTLAFCSQLVSPQVTPGCLALTWFYHGHAGCELLVLTAKTTCHLFLFTVVLEQEGRILDLTAYMEIIPSLLLRKHESILARF